MYTNGQPRRPAIKLYESPAVLEPYSARKRMIVVDATVDNGCETRFRVRSPADTHLSSTMYLQKTFEVEIEEQLDLHDETPHLVDHPERTHTVFASQPGILSPEHLQKHHVQLHSS